ncbi:MAG: sugar phosphate isomerase/epimerase [Clostridia bacterium]|nr:sugar phosphate isomerase/epimerase [Clostridia bacterium]
MQILPSIGAFIGRVNGRDPHAFLRISDRLEAEAFEFLMYEAFYPRLSEILGDYRASGLSFPVFHIEKRIGELVTLGELANATDRFERNLEAAATLGADTLVLHLWNGPPSDREFSRNLAAYATFAEKAAAAGLLLTVENVVCAERDPLTRFSELLAAHPTVSFTYDTKMAAHHRQETALFSPENAALLRAVRHVHLNDYGGTPGDFSGLATLHLGEGKLDIPAIASHLLRAGYRGRCTLECGCMRPDGTLMPEKMNASLTLARRLLAEGNTERSDP